MREGHGRGSDAIFVNCTFAENKSGSGGAVALYGTSAVGAYGKFISCTIKGNSADKGGGIWMNNATPTAEFYNTIITDNGTDIGYGGTVVAQESQVSKSFSIIGSTLLNADGNTVSGWTFNASSMLGALDFHNGGATKSFPLIPNGANPAINQGMSTSELNALATRLGIDSGLATKDQNGQTREKNSIGSYVANN